MLLRPTGKVSLEVSGVNPLRLSRLGTPVFHHST